MISMQLAVDVQVPPCFGGIGGQVIYIDTEGSFLLQRVIDVASAAVRHCSLLVEDDEQRVAMTSFTVETILSNIFLVMMTGHHRSHMLGVKKTDSGRLSLRCVVMTMWSCWLSSTCFLTSSRTTRAPAYW